MDGIHDLGGRQGFGAVQQDSDEQPFPERWQGAVFSFVNALGAAGIIHSADQFRHAIERIDPACYLADGYYGRWLGGVETVLVEAAVLTTEQISQRALALGAAEQDPVAARPGGGRHQGRSAGDLFATADRVVDTPPGYQVGDMVRTLRHGVAGHTRLPAYARNATGTVVACHGAWVYPDTNAHALGEQPQHLYTVAFDGEELWGADAEPGLSVRLDLFEPYLTEVN